MDETNQSSPQNQQILEQQMLEQELMQQQQLQDQAAQASMPAPQPIDSSFGVPVVNPAAVPPAQNSGLGPIANAVPQQSQPLQAPAPKTDPNAPTLNDFSAAQKPAPAPAAQMVDVPAEDANSPQQQYVNEFNNQKAATENIATAQAALETAKEAQYKAKAAKALKTADSIDKINTHFQEQYAQKMGALDQSLEEFKRISAEKPQTAADIWEKKSTGQKIQASIAIALGGIGAALQGGGAVNQAYNIIQRGLQDEAEANNSLIKNRLAAEEKAGNIAVTGAKMAMEAESLMQETALKKRLIQYEAIESKINQVASQYNSTQIKENAALLMSKLEQDKLKARLEYDALAKKQAMMASLGGMSAQEFQQLPPAIQAEYPKEIRDAYKDRASIEVPGYGPAANEELAKDFNKNVRPTYEKPLVAIDDLLQSYKTFNRLSYNDRRKMEAKLELLAGQMRLPIIGPGTVQPAEYERLRNVLGNPNKLMSLTSVEKANLLIVKKWLEESLGQAAEAAGLPKKPLRDLKTLYNFTPVSKEPAKQGK